MKKQRAEHAGRQATVLAVTLVKKKKKYLLCYVILVWGLGMCIFISFFLCVLKNSFNIFLSYKKRVKY